MDKIAKSEWQSLVNAKSAEKPQAFVDYAQAVIKAREAGKLTIQEAGYKICGAIYIDELDEIPELEEAISIGCDLELPPAHRSATDEVKSWSKLTKLVDDYAHGRRRGITHRLNVRGEKHDDAGLVVAGVTGWICVKHGRVLVQIGGSKVKAELESIAGSVDSSPNDAGFLDEVQKVTDGREIDGYKISSKVLEHLRGDGHSEFHSANAFCGSAGEEEMRHLSSLVETLTDAELRLLTDRVGIKFLPEDYGRLERVDFENVIDEADREDFYREYRRIITARKKVTGR